MKAVIMAGGKGTRIKSVTNDEVPKNMLKVGGKTILEHQIKCLINANIDEVIIVVGYLKDYIKDYFKDGKCFNIKISYYEEKEPLGTAGSLYYLKKYIKDDFILLYGDIFLNVDLNKMITFHKKNNSDATLLVHPSSHPYDCDLLIIKDNKVVEFIYKREQKEYINLANTGIYCFSNKVFDYVKENQNQDLEKDIISNMLSKSNVCTYETHEYLKDMGTCKRYNELLSDFENNNIYKEKQAVIININDVVFNDVFYKKLKKLNHSKFLTILVYDYIDENIRKKIDTTLGNNGVYFDMYCMKNKLDSLDMNFIKW